MRRKNWQNLPRNCCRTCLSLDISRHGNPKGYRKRESRMVLLKKIEDSAKSKPGCRGCGVLLFAVEPFFDADRYSTMALILIGKLRSLFCDMVGDGVVVHCIEIFRVLPIQHGLSARPHIVSYCPCLTTLIDISWTKCPFSSSPFSYFQKQNSDVCTTVIEWQAEWHRVVSEYTAKLLFFPTDIFPALQGLAKKSQGLSGNYVAGK
jgi:hypothetical protein